MQFSGKNIVITGAAKGIGRAAAEKFLSEGATVILVDKDADADISRYGNNAFYYQCNVAVYTEVQRLFKALESQFQTIDVLVNNAGIQTYGTVTETSEELWDQTLNVNVKSMYLCSRCCIPLMAASDNAVVINLSSVQSFTTQRGVAAYAASKAAILGLTNSIAVDYAPHIRCLAVCPGAVMSPMLKNVIENSPNAAEVLSDVEQIHLLKRVAQPEEIADFIVFAASNKARFMTGQYYRIDGGIGTALGGR